MKWTRNLVRIYDQKLKQKEDLFLLKSLNPKEKRLYEANLTHDSERLLAKELYNGSPSHQSYQSLKKSLSDKLLDAISLSQIGHPLQKQKSKLYRKLTAFYILESLGFRKLFIPLARKIFGQLLRNHMFYEAAGIGRFLSNHYAVYESDQKQAKRYNQEVLKCIDTYKKEVNIEWTYTQVQCLFLEKNFHECADQIKDFGDNHYPYVIQTGSVRMYAFYYLIRYAESVARHDLKGRESVCKEALEFLNSLSFNQVNMKSVFMFHLINTFLEQNELAKAELIIHTFLDESDHRSQLYYRYRELLFRVQL
ncbi:MAG: hypothetical protein HKN67_12005, partial [Saprospiraceae bacterium]|nr:hypothetical protein [Saprospiraceae bacterium]